MEGLHLSGDGLHTFWGKHCIVEADFWLPHPAFPAVEYDAILFSSLHQLDKVPVMLLLDPTVVGYVIMDGSDAVKTVSDLENDLSHV